MKKDNGSDYRSKSLQRYSSSKPVRKNTVKKDLNKREQAKSLYEKKDKERYNSQYVPVKEIKKANKVKIKEDVPKGKITKKKKKLDKKTLRTRIWISILGFVGCFVVVLLGMLMLRYSEISELKYDINSLTRDLEEIKNHKKEIEVELEQSNRSDVIEQIAIEQLQMMYPSDDQIVYIEMD